MPQLPAMLLCSTSSSSEEDGLDAEEAAVERCVRVATPSLIEGGTYEHLSKVSHQELQVSPISTFKLQLDPVLDHPLQVDTCVNDGLNGLEDGKAPSSMAHQIVDCISGKPFPDALKPTVDALKACITAALP